MWPKRERNELFLEVVRGRKDQKVPRASVDDREPAESPMTDCGRIVGEDEYSGISVEITKEELE